MRYIRGDFAGTGTAEDPFRSPDEWKHVVDLRRADGSGGGVFVGADASPLPAGSVELQQGGLGGAALDALWRELTVDSDLLGINGPKTIMPSHTGRMALWLPERRRARDFDVMPGDPEWAAVLATIRLGYLEQRTRALAGLSLLPVGGGVIVDREFHRRYLSALVEKYGLDYRVFQLRDSDLERAVLGPDLPDEPPLPHSTTLTESFDQADSTTLGPDQTWFEEFGLMQTISNVVREQSNGAAMSRVESDLASDDMFVDLDVTLFETSGANFVYIGGAARFQPAARTFFTGSLQQNDTDAKADLDRVIAIGHNLIGSVARTHPHSLPEKVTVEADGSDIRLLLDDVEVISPVTDTGIPTGTRGGIDAFNSIVSAHSWGGDNWLAADGQAGAPSGDPAIIEMF